MLNPESDSTENEADDAPEGTPTGAGSDDSSTAAQSAPTSPSIGRRIIDTLRRRRLLAMIVAGLVVITALVVKSFAPSPGVEQAPLALSDSLRLEQEFEKIVSGETNRLYVAGYEISDAMLDDLPIEFLREAKRKALVAREQSDESQRKEGTKKLAIAEKEIYNDEGKRINFDPPEWEDYPRIDAVLIDQGKITDEGLATLAELPDLEHIRLRLSPISDNGIKLLAGCDELWLVNLPHSELTNEGLRLLASFPKLKQLRLGSKRLTNDCCREIAELVNLRGLHLIGIPVTDDGVKILAELPHLESLYLDDSAVTESGWQWVFRNHPELHVHVDQSHLDRDPQAHPH